MYALQKFFGLALIKIVELAIQIFSKNSIVFSEDIFSSNALFKENYLPIKNEYLSYIEKYELDNMSDIFEEQKRIAPDDNWKNVMLLLYGEVIIKHQLHFPFTSQLIKNNPNITSAFFSVLEPGKKITKHRGPYKGLLRYHLGLIVPKSEECYLKIDKKYFWEEGNSFIFDDTFEHEAQNLSNETRVILFIDFIRPLPFPLSVFNKFLIILMQKSLFIKKVVLKLNAKTL